MNKIIALTALVLFSVVAKAGDRIGNGGGLWVCANPSNQFSKGFLVDLFEAKNEFGLSVPVSAEKLAQDIAQKKAQLLNSANSVYAEKIQKYLAEVLQKVRFVDAVLEKVDDALYRIAPLPATCEAGTWQYLQFANFTSQDQVLIRNDIWKSNIVAEQDKGALLVHEAVYRWLRREYSDTDSIRSRQIVGLLFSDLLDSEIARRIQTLLGPSQDPGVLDTWACEITNRNMRSFFIGYGKSRDEASFNSAQSCSQASSGGFFCHPTDATCEQAQTNASVWFCSVQNQNSGQLFSGRGSTKVEASYHAQKTCADTSGAGFFCENTTCSLTSFQSIK